MIYNPLDPPPDKWRTVTQALLEQWLKAYPRPLIPNPPLAHKKAPVRRWRDPTLGNDESADVASWSKHRKSTYCQVLRVIPQSDPGPAVTSPEG